MRWMQCSQRNVIRVMSRLLLVALVTVSLGIGGVRPAQACSCYPMTVGELLDTQAYVSVVIAEPTGQVRGLLDRFPAQTNVAWELSVQEAWGDDVANPLIVRSSAQSSACGFTALSERPRAYLLYLDGGDLWIDTCSSPQGADEVRQVAADLGWEPAVITAGPSQGRLASQYRLLLLVATGAVATGAAMLMRRRNRLGDHLEDDER